MPFRSRSQLGVCYQKSINAGARGKSSGWDCDKWLAESQNPSCLPYREGSSSASSASSASPRKCRSLAKNERVAGPVMVGARGGHYFMAGGVKVYIPKGDAQLAYAIKKYGSAKSPAKPKVKSPAKPKVKAAAKAKSAKPKAKSPAKAKARPGGRSKSWKVKLYPELLSDQSTFDISTGNAALDRKVATRISGKFGKGVVEDVLYGYRITSYEYDRKTNAITVGVTTPKPMSAEELRQKVIEAIDMGPDTWMEGNIVIVSALEAVSAPGLPGVAELVFGVGEVS